jgi:hypothetical protein
MIVGDAYLRWLQTQTGEYTENSFTAGDGWLIRQEA